MTASALPAHPAVNSRMPDSFRAHTPAAAAASTSRPQSRDEAPLPLHADRRVMRRCRRGRRHEVLLFSHGREAGTSRAMTADVVAIAQPASRAMMRGGRLHRFHAI